MVERRCVGGSTRAATENTLVALVVEPDAAVANLIRLVLESEGCRVNVAATGHVALDSAQIVRPQLAVLEASAPGVAAATTTVALRMVAGRDLPILALSDRTQTVDLAALGCYAALAMPFEFHELLNALRQGLALGRRLAAEPPIPGPRAKPRRARRPRRSVLPSRWECGSPKAS